MRNMMIKIGFCVFCCFWFVGFLVDVVSVFAGFFGFLVDSICYWLLVVLLVFGVYNFVTLLFLTVLVLASF